MCGITVLRKLTGHEVAEEVEFAWDGLSHRGTDSYGIFAIKSDGSIIIERSMSLKSMVYSFETKYRKDEFDIVVAHNRKASIGGVRLDLAHPIKVDNIVVVQNGTNYGVTSIITDAESDTQAIAKLLANRKNEFVKKYLNDWLSGSGVVIAYDLERKKWLFWKDRTRPLVFYRYLGYFYSEPLVIDADYNLIRNTDKLVIKKKFDNLFKKGKKFSIDEMMYPGTCSICRRSMLLMIDCYGYGKYYGKYNSYYCNHDDSICWECKVLGKSKQKKAKAKYDKMEKLDEVIDEWDEIESMNWRWE